MPSPFQSALTGYLEAHAIHWAIVRSNPTSPRAEEQSEKALAQAGDVLEAELRKMMREEARVEVSSELRPRVVLPHGGILGEP